MCKVTKDLPGCIVSGDTLPAITYTVTEDGVPANLLGAHITIIFKGSTGKTLKIVEGEGITITEGANGQFRIDSISRLTLPPGKYSGDVVIDYANGEQYTDVTLILTVV